MFKFLVFLAVILFACKNEAAAQLEYVDVTIDYENIIAVSSFITGVAHTQYSLDPWGNQAAINNGKVLLENSTIFQNQHIMGWGATNPWPDSIITSSADWDWESLDRRISLIRETNGVPVITLCACPTWMHTPSKNGTTDWTAIEKAPTPDHYHKFARLCAEVARRYPDVKHFQVWNEFKGFYLAAENRWDYENYTLMYNIIYDSLKEINPALKIGGPYITMDSWSTDQISHPSALQGEYGVMDQRPLDVILYWLENRHGAEFISVDGGTANKDGIWLTNAFAAGQKFVDVINWIRQQEWGADTLPVWWCEWYVYPSCNDPQDNLALNNAVMTSCMIKTVKAGYSNAIIWQPQGDSRGYSFPVGIWTDTQLQGGGQPTQYYYSQKAFKDFFSDGSLIYDDLSSSPNISVLASDNNTMLVNHLNEQVYVVINDSIHTILSSYEVQLSQDFSPVKNTTFFNEIKIFPNPALDFITITNKGNTNSEMSWEIFNIYGQRLFYCNTCKLHSRGEIIIDIKNIEPGIYFLKIIIDNKSFSRQFLKSM
jgi:hypothetical protein